MLKIMVPETGTMDVGAIRAILQGKAEDEAVAFQGGRYVDPPVIEGADAPDEDAPAADGAAVPDGASAPKKRKRA